MYLTKIATSLIGGAVLLEDTGSSDIFLPVCSCNFGMQEDGFEWKVLRASEKLERNNLFCTYQFFVCHGILRSAAKRGSCVFLMRYKYKKGGASCQGCAAFLRGRVRFLGVINS